MLQGTNCKLHKFAECFTHIVVERVDLFGAAIRTGRVLAVSFVAVERDSAGLVGGRVERMMRLMQWTLMLMQTVNWSRTWSLWVSDLRSDDWSDKMIKARKG